MELEVKPDTKSVDAPEPCGLLIVDGEHIAYRAFHAYTGAGKMNPRTTKGKPTSVLYGFLSMLKRKLTDLNPKEVVVCWGGKRSELWRRRVYPEYKADREVQDPSLYQQIDELKRVLHILGINQLLSSHEEADDLVANCVFKWIREGHLFSGSVYIMTNDHDLRSLIQEHVFVVSPNPGGVDILWDVSAITAKYGIAPVFLPDAYAMVGDDDNIPGVKGIGLVTACRIIQEAGPVEQWKDSIDSLKINNSLKTKLKGAIESVLMFKRLMVFDPTRPLEDMTFWSGEFNPTLAEQYFMQELEFRKITVHDFRRVT